MEHALGKHKTNLLQCFFFFNLFIMILNHLNRVDVNFFPLRVHFKAGSLKH